MINLIDNIKDKYDKVYDFFSSILLSSLKQIDNNNYDQIDRQDITLGEDKYVIKYNMYNFGQLGISIENNNLGSLVFEKTNSKNIGNSKYIFDTIIEKIKSIISKNLLHRVLILLPVLDLKLTELGKYIEYFENNYEEIYEYLKAKKQVQIDGLTYIFEDNKKIKILESGKFNKSTKKEELKYIMSKESNYRGKYIKSLLKYLSKQDKFKEGFKGIEKIDPIKKRLLLYKYTCKKLNYDLRKDPIIQNLYYIPISYKKLGIDKPKKHYIVQNNY